MQMSNYRYYRNYGCYLGLNLRRKGANTEVTLRQISSGVAILISKGRRWTVSSPSGIMMDTETVALFNSTG